MPAFLTFVLLGWRRGSAYPAATAAGAFTNTVFGFIKAAITMGAVAAAGGTLAGYDALDAATYAWLTQALIAPVYVFVWSDFAERIRTGDVAVDLARPVDPQLHFLGMDLGRAAFALVPRGAPPLLVGAVVTGLALPAEVLPYLLGIVSLVLAVVVSFAARWLLNLAAVWMTEIRGPLTLYMVASNILCGLVVPVHWFPDWLAMLARATPFPSMLQAPVDVITGRVTGLDAVAVLGVQAGWAVTLLVAGRLVWRRVVNRLVVQGG
ncbi:ABC transporter permease [Millisia brevis]|uniref:ABC transporter permease n=1 Tax=Millisia brevis TaxID=264148 RepID=UPI000836C842|nr:ABC-2 family transporter protein [Millisia brevis]